MLARCFGYGPKAPSKPQRGACAAQSGTASASSSSPASPSMLPRLPSTGSPAAEAVCASPATEPAKSAASALDDSAAGVWRTGAPAGQPAAAAAGGGKAPAATGGCAAEGFERGHSGLPLPAPASAAGTANGAALQYAGATPARPASGASGGDSRGSSSASPTPRSHAHAPPTPPPLMRPHSPGSPQQQHGMPPRSPLSQQPSGGPNPSRLGRALPYSGSWGNGQQPLPGPDSGRHHHALERPGSGPPAPTTSTASNGISCPLTLVGADAGAPQGGAQGDECAPRIKGAPTSPFTLQQVMWDADADGLSLEGCGPPAQGKDSQSGAGGDASASGQAAAPVPAGLLRTAGRCGSPTTASLPASRALSRLSSMAQQPALLPMSPHGSSALPPGCGPSEEQRAYGEGGAREGGVPSGGTPRGATRIGSNLMARAPSLSHHLALAAGGSPLSPPGGAGSRTYAREGSGNSNGNGHPSIRVRAGSIAGSPRGGGMAGVEEGSPAACSPRHAAMMPPSSPRRAFDSMAIPLRRTPDTIPAAPKPSQARSLRPDPGLAATAGAGPAQGGRAIAAGAGDAGSLDDAAWRWQQAQQRHGSAAAEVQMCGLARSGSQSVTHGSQTTRDDLASRLSSEIQPDEESREEPMARHMSRHGGLSTSARPDPRVAPAARAYGVQGSSYMAGGHLPPEDAGAELFRGSGGSAGTGSSRPTTAKLVAPFSGGAMPGIVVRTPDALPAAPSPSQSRSLRPQTPLGGAKNRCTSPAKSAVPEGGLRQGKSWADRRLPDSSSSQRSGDGRPSGGAAWSGAGAGAASAASVPRLPLKTPLVQAGDASHASMSPRRARSASVPAAPAPVGVARAETPEGVWGEAAGHGVHRGSLAVEDLE